MRTEKSIWIYLTNGNCRLDVNTCAQCKIEGQGKEFLRNCCETLIFCQFAQLKIILSDMMMTETVL